MIPNQLVDGRQVFKGVPGAFLRADESTENLLKQPEIWTLPHKPKYSRHGSYGGISQESGLVPVQRRVFLAISSSGRGVAYAKYGEYTSAQTIVFL
ncbi:MAG: hypothetical protein DRJ61_02245 [Acidobacteria bacterium]|nr:MAG: hypothetical protein DRJ61_02245 [Acidobacteriota bacterium]